MTDCYYTVCHIIFLNHHIRNGLTDNIAPPYNDKVFTLKLFYMPVYKYLASVRSTGDKTLIACNKLTHIDRMETVNVLNRIYGIYNSLFINMFR